MMKMKSYVCIVENLKATVLGVVVKTIGLLQKRCYNIKLETEKGKYERAINDKCRRSSRAFERHTCLGQTSMCQQENQCCTSRQSMGSA
jgi:hypothetical protein